MKAGYIEEQLTPYRQGYRRSAARWRSALGGWLLTGHECHSEDGVRPPDQGMLRINHSCAPNVGMDGNVLLVAMRDVAVGEELTIDYALFLADPGFAMACRCGTTACRSVVRGTDWMRPEVRERYRGWFSWWLQQKITQTRDHLSR